MVFGDDYMTYVEWCLFAVQISSIWAPEKRFGFCMENLIRNSKSSVEKILNFASLLDWRRNISDFTRIFTKMERGVKSAWRWVRHHTVHVPETQTEILCKISSLPGLAPLFLPFLVPSIIFSISISIVIALESNQWRWKKVPQAPISF